MEDTIPLGAATTARATVHTYSTAKGKSPGASSGANSKRPDNTRSQHRHRGEAPIQHTFDRQADYEQGHADAVQGFSRQSTRPHYRAGYDKGLSETNAPRCPGCGRVMSHREAGEQGECNDCHPGGAYDPNESGGNDAQ